MICVTISLYGYVPAEELYVVAARKSLFRLTLAIDNRNEVWLTGISLTSLYSNKYHFRNKTY